MTIEDRVTNMVCDYITKRIKTNLRVTDESQLVNILGLTMTQELKEELNKAVKLIPDNVTIVQGKWR